MSDLSDFIDKYVDVAKTFRGLSLRNPVHFTITKNSKTYQLVVGMEEPDENSVPFNVLWIMVHPDAADYKTLMRREDATKYDDRGYRGNWAVLTTLASAWTEDQYYKKVTSPIVGEVTNFLPSIATVSNLGGFMLTTDAANPASPVAVGTNDTRMTDKRTPTDHTHIKNPVTMLKVNSTKHITVNTVNDPVAGQILYLFDVDEDGNYLGEWGDPNMTFPHTGLYPVSLTITGPTVKVPSASNHILRATGTLSDGTVEDNVVVVWSIPTSIENHEYGAINASTGVFSAYSVVVDTPVTVRATWTDASSGITIYVDYVITIEGDPTIVTVSYIEIVGADSILKTGSAETYVVVAHYSDGSSADVVPGTFSSSNAAACTLTGMILTPNLSIIRDKVTTLKAIYTDSYGIQKTVTKDVTIVDPTVYPQSVAISGSASVDMSSTSQYTATVTMTDGTTVTTGITWSNAPTTYATVNSSGLLTTLALTAQGNKTTTLTASYTLNGQSASATKDITIVNTAIWPVSSAISGSSAVLASGTATYVFTVTYSDNSTQVITPTWGLSSSAMGTITAAGVFTAGTSAATGNVTATYTESGISLNATFAVAVESSDLPIASLRWGVAMFANTEFTGGPIASEITEEEAAYGVTAETSPSGLQYTHWTGLQDFCDSVMTNTVDIAAGGTGIINDTITIDQYLYVMWDARIDSLAIVNLANNFTVTFEGIYWRNDVLGNYEGLPGYDANLPTVMTIQYDDGTGLRDWKIIRQEATTVAGNSPRSDRYQVTYSN